MVTSYDNTTWEPRHGHAATQGPVADWHARFPDPTIGDAILHRLVHNAYRLEPTGESRRKLDSPLPIPTS